MVGAAAAVLAAVIAYGVGPYSVERVTAAPGGVAWHEPMHRSEPERPAPATRHAVSSSTHRVTFSINPSNAYLSLRRTDEPEERRSGGPWPRTLDLEPGEYELVVFRAGYRAVVRRLTVSDSSPSAMDIVLRTEDIYE